VADIRKNQNESIKKAAEASRAGTREAVNQTQDAVSAGVEGFKQITDQFTRAFGFAGQSEDLTRRAAQNLEAVTESGSVLVRGFQDVCREWIELAQQRQRGLTVEMPHRIAAGEARSCHAARRAALPVSAVIVRAASLATSIERSAMRRLLSIIS
jgi:hypothetical protein